MIRRLSLRDTLRPGMALVLIACASDAPIAPATPEAIVITSPAASLLAGGTLQLTAVVTTRGGTVTRMPVVWSSSDSTVLTVSSAGLVSGVVKGVAAVTATAGPATGRTELAVLGVRSVQVLPAAVTLSIGTTQPLVALIDADPGLATPTVSWRSAAPATAAVSNTGVVTGVAAGTTTVTATAQGRSGTTIVTVLRPVTVQSIRLTPTSAALTVGGTNQLVAVTLDSLGNTLTGRPLTWVSNAPAVASVSATGLVTAVAPGTATVTVSSEGRQASATVSVRAVTARLDVTPASLTLRVGEQRPLAITARDAGGTILPNAPITWTSSNPLIASISTAGTVTGTGIGTATITVRSDAASATVPVTVSASGFDPNQGLMAHYPLTGDATDASQYGLDGTGRGAVLASDRFGTANRAYRFGSGQEITIPRASLGLCCRLRRRSDFP